MTAEGANAWNTYRIEIPLIDLSPPHFVACPAIYGFWLPLLYHQTLLESVSSKDLDCRHRMLWSFCLQWCLLRYGCSLWWYRCFFTITSPLKLSFHTTQQNGIHKKKISCICVLCGFPDHWKVNKTIKFTRVYIGCI